MSVDYRTFQFVFGNKVIVRKIFQSIPEIHATISFNQPKHSFQSLPSYIVSYFKVDLRSSHDNNDDDDNDQKSKDNFNQRSLKLLYSKLKHDDTFILAFKAVPSILRHCRDVKILKEIVRRFPLYPRHTLSLTIFDQVDQTNDVPDQTSKDCTGSPFWFAHNIAAGGNLECLEYVVNELGILPSAATALMACEYGHEHILHYLNTVHKIKITQNAFEIACFNGHTCIVVYLLKHYPSLKFKTIALLNILNGKGSLKDKYDISKLLIDNIPKRLLPGEVLLNVKFVDIAVRLNSLDLVKLYYTRFGENSVSGFAFDYMANLDILIYLEQQLTIPTNPSTMSYIAGNGYLDIYSYMHENRSEPCTESAMSAACSAGHLNLVKYIVERTSCYLDSTTFHNATINGHLEVVDFLIKNLQFDLPDQSIAFVCSKGKGDYSSVAKYLLENNLTPYSRNPSVDSHSLFALVAKRGNMELMTWMMGYFGFQTFKDISPLVKDHNDKIQDPLSNEFIGKCVLELIDNSHFSMLVWVLDQYRELLNPEALRDLVVRGTPSLEIVSFLYSLDNNVFRGNTEKSRFNPVTYHIIRFLHQHDCCHLTPHCIDIIAASGDYKSIQYIYTNTNYRGTSMTFVYSIKYGHIEVAKFIHDHSNAEEISREQCIKEITVRYECIQFLFNLFNDPSHLLPHFDKNMIHKVNQVYTLEYLESIQLKLSNQDKVNNNNNNNNNIGFLKRLSKIWKKN
ncbi:hypothetical protein DFA_07466 [Cavenderia fasciculata]|uniref:Ankyrin repeat-containing protein n=1 Tax=Cavenderia fasciculata TaxID=261658 RepID=F4PWH8_CACFS|nr:uncharacterized protein DFA_07466 [Cavenderia fasciculata]EGG20342.1 hypothetical protein DFA_07466 [Cavenderia fasciculata]|eukprot:XP_004367325.1 hypothetical protein DFA_07466 [Cavenderia fasciculata]